MNNKRKLQLIKNYKPCLAYENDEIYPNGIFNFNISKILNDINCGTLEVEKEKINISEWFKTHMHGVINESHISSVDITRPVLQAEIRLGKFEIIYGNHRIEKEYRNNIKTINSYKLNGEKLVDYFIDKRGYEAFVQYWNSKL
ncbi:MAG: hypothetical protein ACOCP8_09900 [archaeon]